MQNEKLTTRGLPGHLEPHHALAALDADGPDARQLPSTAASWATADDLEQVLHRQVLDYAEKNYKKYFTAPEKYTAVRSLSSLEHYAEQQKPQPPKPATP